MFVNLLRWTYVSGQCTGDEAWRVWTKNTPDVPGGVIVRDKDGNPSGIFKDAAKGLIERVEPTLSMNHILGAVRAAQKYANENGVTSVQDMGVFFTQIFTRARGRRWVDVIQRLPDSGKTERFDGSHF